jgi:hypothetical protein
MSLGPALDVAIGLVFVYLLLGLITTAVQELVANVFRWRGTMLKQAIADLVADGAHAAPFFQKVFGHGLIRGTKMDRPPSYLTAQKFTLALIDTLGDGGQGTAFSQVETGISALPAGAARDALMALVKDAAGDLDTLKKNLSSWYDDAMDRLTGVYKRRTQLFAVLFGLAVAVVLNVDSLRIADRLWHDEALRSSIAAAAGAYVSSHTQLPTNDGDDQAARKQIDDNVTQLDALDLPIGWDAVVKQTAVDAAKTRASPQDTTKTKPQENPADDSRTQILIWWDAVTHYLYSNGLGGFLLVLLGWIVTGVATSLGAPFWFDALKNILNVRSAGPKPPRADNAEAAR